MLLIKILIIHFLMSHTKLLIKYSCKQQLSSPRARRR